MSPGQRRCNKPYKSERHESTPKACTVPSKYKSPCTSRLKVRPFSSLTYVSHRRLKLRKEERATAVSSMLGVMCCRQSVRQKTVRHTKRTREATNPCATGHQQRSQTDGRDEYAVACYAWVQGVDNILFETGIHHEPTCLCDRKTGAAT